MLAKIQSTLWLTSHSTKIKFHKDKIHYIQHILFFHFVYNHSNNKLYTYNYYVTSCDSALVKDSYSCIKLFHIAIMRLKKLQHRPISFNSKLHVVRIRVVSPSTRLLRKDGTSSRRRQRPPRGPACTPSPPYTRPLSPTFRSDRGRVSYPPRADTDPGHAFARCSCRSPRYDRRRQRTLQISPAQDGTRERRPRSFSFLP